MLASEFIIVFDFNRFPIKILIMFDFESELTIVLKLFF